MSAKQSLKNTRMLVVTRVEKYDAAHDRSALSASLLAEDTQPQPAVVRTNASQNGACNRTRSVHGFRLVDFHSASRPFGLTAGSAVRFFGNRAAATIAASVRAEPPCHHFVLYLGTSTGRGPRPFGSRSCTGIALGLSPTHRPTATGILSRMEQSRSGSTGLTRCRSIPASSDRRRSSSRP